MPATVVERADEVFEVTFTMSLKGTMLEMEEQLQESLNETGCSVMGKALERFDTE